MSYFAIIADAGCDLSEEFQQQYDIRIVNGHLIFPGGVEMLSFLKSLRQKYSRLIFLWSQFRISRLQHRLIYLLQHRCMHIFHRFHYRLSLRLSS